MDICRTYIRVGIDDENIDICTYLGSIDAYEYPLYGISTVPHRGPQIRCQSVVSTIFRVVSISVISSTGGSPPQDCKGMSASRPGGCLLKTGWVMSGARHGSVETTD